MRGEDSIQSSGFFLLYTLFFRLSGFLIQIEGTKELSLGTLMGQSMDMDEVDVIYYYGAFISTI